MSLALFAALGGWLAAGAAGAFAVRLRRRLRGVALAEHELRRPGAVLRLWCERMRRDPVARRHALVIEVELERLTAGLADLTAARTGREPRRPPLSGGGPGDLRSFAGGALAAWSPSLWEAGREARLDWRAGRVALPADRGHLAQALGNLVANAAEHGSGAVELRGRRVPGGVRVEVRNELGGPAARPSRPGSTEPLPGAEQRGLGTAVVARAGRRIGARVAVERSPREFVAALELPVEGAPGGCVGEQGLAGGEAALGVRRAGLHAERAPRGFARAEPPVGRGLPRGGGEASRGA